MVGDTSLVDRYHHQAYYYIENVCLSPINIFGECVCDGFEEEPNEQGLISPIPNVFSPNGDGVNDSFTVESKSTYWQCTIYNRWGKEIKIQKAYKNDKWYFVHAKESNFYNTKSNKVRIFTIPRLTDDGEKCFSAEIYSDHLPKAFNYAIN